MSRIDVAVLGSLNLDVVIGVDHFPRPGETIMSRSVTNVTGGKGANQAIAAARMGVKVSMIGAVGSDDAGRTLLASLQEAGVDTSAVDVLDGGSGVAQVIVDHHGQNMIMVHAGANGRVTAEAAAAATPPARVYLAQLETPLAAIEAFFAKAAEAGGLTILNTAPAVPDARALFKHAAIVILNETELAAYAPDLDPVAAARSLICRPAQCIIVTLGAMGAIAVTQVDDIGIAAHPVTPVDTTGAGDCFCGVLAALLARRNDLQTAMRRACDAASIAVTRPGAGPSMPTAAELGILVL